MLKLLFNRESILVKVAFYLGLLLMAFFFYQGQFQVLSLIEKILFIFFLLQVLFSKAMQLYPWYPSSTRGPGIRFQFDREMVPVSYILGIGFLLLQFPFVKTTLFFLNLLLLPISLVACIIGYLHYQDDLKEPNILSGSHGH